jgi:RNA polymerase sigma factor (sigma-70 family)
MQSTGLSNAVHLNSQAPRAAGSTEFQLVRQIIEGRSEQFVELIEPQMPALRRIVRRKMGCHPEVEDIVQETLLKAYMYIRQFRFEASLGTWLARIATNEVRQWYRRHAQSRWSKLEDHGMEESNLADSLPSPLEMFERREKSSTCNLRWLRFRRSTGM